MAATWIALAVAAHRRARGLDSRKKGCCSPSLWCVYLFRKGTEFLEEPKQQGVRESAGFISCPSTPGNSSDVFPLRAEYRFQTLLLQINLFPYFVLRFSHLLGGVR